ncbi:DUF1506 family protein [Borrelia miyamotoi]|uniref:DUF1506 family protein n=1 Tax=Borrelia miyamotoi TaxID=47466 RepID=A0AAQ2X1Y8_9SPIR|nr:DUF1506 family protein [Borrelia miyamotoi]AOW96103.1 hypothetical protein AXH25_05335 [Borrelia miyamotoi]AOW96145.1 hypothetical protein AXH25_05570 [Borrelia miyamotoi]AOW96201.1 hypothetical protein AXH25_05910 [Borrelia miyamotoi]QTL84001.1 DUF1506 family protein [Borrelia miyamotoi]QTL84033.1 DUF1506 family protein [Borrelia miyamotoi]
MNLRNRISSMATRMINRFAEEALFKFYKGIHDRDEELQSNEITFSKHTYTEFVGIIIDISERELSLIEDSGLFDSSHLAKLYTYANLEFDIQDRVALDEEYFEIIKLDYSLGYKTLILRRIAWT